MSREIRALTSAQIRDALDRLDTVLAARGVKASLYVVGGAAIALEYDGRRSTVDVDAVFRPAPEVLAAASTVATEMGLPPDWLNSRASAFMPDHDPPPPPEAPGLHVAFASTTVLLAMKLLSNRERDFDDLVVLTRTLGLTEPHELVAIVHEVYPDGWGPRMPDDEELTIDAAEVLREVRSRLRKDG